jgi:hypothetical protein
MQATFISLRSTAHTFHIGGTHSFLMSEPSSDATTCPQTFNIVPHIL